MGVNFNFYMFIHSMFEYLSGVFKAAITYMRIGFN